MGESEPKTDEKQATNGRGPGPTGVAHEPQGTRPWAPHIKSLCFGPSVATTWPRLPWDSFSKTPVSEQKSNKTTYHMNFMLFSKMCMVL